MYEPPCESAQQPADALPWWQRVWSAILALAVRLRLAPRWRETLKRSWSFKLFAVSVACQVLDVLLSTAGMFAGHYAMSVALQLAGVAFAALGLWARLVFQKGLSRE